MNFITRIRAEITSWLLKRAFAKRVFLARRVCPSTTSLMALGKRRRNRALPLPELTHLIYHQHTVETDCAENSLRSIAPNVANSDEVIVFDNGKTLHPECHGRFADSEWFSYVGCNCTLPEQRSYTYGLNSVVPTAKSPLVILWRTDYVYPAGMRDAYLAALVGREIVIPESVRLGNVEADGAFVSRNWHRFERSDAEFLSGCSRLLSLRASDDPAMFAIRGSAWVRLGGMSHQLWGYGWQFAELSSRINLLLRGKVAYLPDYVPFHQHHGSSMQHAIAEASPDMEIEIDSGRKRLRQLLGSDSAFESYLFRWQVNQHAGNDGGHGGGND